jgi:O-antigen/teichoic acid export membrane protein
MPDLARHPEPAGIGVALPRQLASRCQALVSGFLPPGTLPVAAGLMVLGIGLYAHLAIAGHSLHPAGMAAMSVLWSIVFLLGLGVFLPIEQEVSRRVAARTAVGEGIAPLVRRAALLAAAILTVILVAIAASAGPLAGRMFGGDTAMVAALATASAALAVVSVSRGTLAGLGRFPAYGSQLATDGGLRVVLAGALGIAGVRSAAAFGLILTVAPLLAVTVTAGPLLAGLRPGPAVSWQAMGGRLGMLIVTMLLAQLIVNVAVISARLLSPGDPAMVSALLAGAVVARAPLFVFTSVQTSLLPGLAGATAAGDQARFRRLLARGCAIVVLLGIAGGLLATVFGPWLTRVLFAARPLLGNADFAWLAAGTLCYLLALLLGQAMMALSRHRDLVLCWLAGVVVLAISTLAPGEVKQRVVTAFAFGSFTVAVTLAAMLWHGSRYRPVRVDAWPRP